MLLDDLSFGRHSIAPLLSITYKTRAMPPIVTATFARSTYSPLRRIETLATITTD